MIARRTYGLGRSYRARAYELEPRVGRDAILVERVTKSRRPDWPSCRLGSLLASRHGHQCDGLNATRRRETGRGVAAFAYRVAAWCVLSLWERPLARRSRILSIPRRSAAPTPEPVPVATPRATPSVADPRNRPRRWSAAGHRYELQKMLARSALAIERGAHALVRRAP